MAQESNPDFVILNGTGSTIGEIQIVPSAKKYPKNKNSYAVQDLELKDTGAFEVRLPNQMRGMDSFDMVIKYGKRNAETKKSIEIDRNAALPLYVLNIKGKESSIPLLTGVGSAGALAAGIGFGFATTCAAYGAGGVAYYLALIGSVVGGGRAAGTAVIAAAPVAVPLLQICLNER
jgi:hypothetical protein